MAIFDLESFRDYYLDLFKTNLNTKIGDINTEKADIITLDTFEDAQFTPDLNEKVMNYEQYIDHGISSIELIPNPNNTAAQNITMFFMVVFTGIEGGQVVETKIMRYTRALQEVALNDIGNNAQIQSIEIKPFAPIDVKDNLSSQYMKIGGIEITGTIG